LVTSADGTKLNAFKIEDMVRDVPFLRAQDMHKFKENEKKQRVSNVTDFFKDMLNDKVDNEQYSEDNYER
jgi:hypothetical protein